jgi:flagellar biosynthetic protein FliQ
MTPDIVVDIFKEGILLLILFVCILIIPSLVVGLFISVMQAATQINEQSLSFVPRLVVTFITISVSAPMLSKMITDYTFKLFELIPHWVA